MFGMRNLGVYGVGSTFAMLKKAGASENPERPEIQADFPAE